MLKHHLAYVIGAAKMPALMRGSDRSSGFSWVAPGRALAIMQTQSEDKAVFTRLGLLKTLNGLVPLICSSRKVH